MVGQTGHEPHIGLLERHLDQGRHDRVQIGRARHIGRLAPALAAADHARHEDLRLARGEPRADLLAQHPGKVSVGNRGDAARGLHPLQHASVSRQPEGAEAACAPIYADHRAPPQCSRMF